MRLRRATRTLDEVDYGSTVLVADDDATIRRLLRIPLEELGLAVLEARNGEEAWKLFRETLGSTTLVVTDIRMPRMNGLDLAQKVRHIQPDFPVILLTGSPADLNNNVHHLPVMAKPFSSSEALAIICNSLHLEPTSVG
jgi:DNA-binding NtrC family response regulator